jgi:hypothetical protein
MPLWQSLNSATNTGAGVCHIDISRAAIATGHFGLFVRNTLYIMGLRQFLVTKFESGTPVAN